MLEAISRLRRADFLPEAAVDHAGGDYPYPIGYGQTISQPYVVAYMTQALGLTGNERVLEIGTGSGYQTAVLAQLCQEVYSIEFVEPLHLRAREVLGRLGFQNVQLRRGDGYAGWPDAAPFDAILVTAAPPRLPEALISQLARGGRMVAPIGADAENQQLVLLRKSLGGELSYERLMQVRFVPMVGGVGQPQA